MWLRTKLFAPSQPTTQHPHARSSRLLLGQRGPMTPDGARDGLRTAQAGVTDVHPHRFRHTLTHRWLAGGRSGT